MRNLRKIALVAGLAAAALALSGVAAAKPGSGGTTTTTTTAPATASVKILAPFFGTAVVAWKGFTFIGSITDPNGAAAGDCQINWGDGTSDVVDGSSISATTSNCGTAHAYTTSGFYYITATGTDANGYVGASSAVLVIVF